MRTGGPLGFRKTWRVNPPAPDPAANGVEKMGLKVFRVMKIWSLREEGGASGTSSEHGETYAGPGHQGSGVQYPGRFDVVDDKWHSGCYRFFMYSRVAAC